ncbi:MAG: hypothetical protein KDD64_15450, partial [Bdellovibrionales bacterium]|nr:hypothetical protein [Bdellovibrionales bacterium]
VESQFFLLSDIGEGALCLPLEPAFYWASTNNGDDNQLFNEILAQTDGDFALALRHAVQIAPFGAKALMEQNMASQSSHSGGSGSRAVSNIVHNLIEDASESLTH